MHHRSPAVLPHAPKVQQSLVTSFVRIVDHSHCLMLRAACLPGALHAGVCAGWACRGWEIKPGTLAAD
jgi:hypothetical protein